MEHLKREMDEEPQNGGPGEPGFEMRAVGKGCPILDWVKEPNSHPEAFSDGAVDLGEISPSREVHLQHYFCHSIGRCHPSRWSTTFGPTAHNRLGRKHQSSQPCNFLEGDYLALDKLTEQWLSAYSAPSHQGLGPPPTPQTWASSLMEFWRRLRIKSSRLGENPTWRLD